MLKYFPEPNQPGTSLARNYLRNAVVPTDSDEFNQPVDWVENGKMTWFGRLRWGNDFQEQAATFLTLGGPSVGWITAERGRAVKRWVREDGSFWRFHDSSCASLFNQDDRDVAGAVFIGHPPIRPYEVKIVNHDHPIIRGVNDFVVTDKQHFVVYGKDPNTC